MAKYRTLWKHISQAYKAYGGFKEFALSPFLHGALFLSLLCSPLLSAEQWADWAISISPSLLGFTLAGYTIFISSLSPTLTLALTRATDGEYSVYRKINVTFFHFIFVQVCSIVFALVFFGVTDYSFPNFLVDVGVVTPTLAAKMNAAGYLLLGFFGQSLLFYSIVSVIAVIVWIYRIIAIVEKSQVL